MTEKDYPETTDSRARKVCLGLLSSVPPDGCHGLDGQALEALSRGMCAWCGTFRDGCSLTDSARELLSSIWQEGFRRIALYIDPDAADRRVPDAGGSVRELLLTMLFLYHIAYSSSPVETAGDGRCDMAASGIVDRLCLSLRHGDLHPDDEEEALLVLLISCLYTYVTDGDMDEDVAVRYAVTAAARWSAAPVPAAMTQAQERVHMLRLRVLEFSDNILGPAPAVLPQPRSLTTTEGLASLCTLLSRRLSDLPSLTAATTALSAALASAPDSTFPRHLSAAASLLEGLCAQKLIEEERLALGRWAG